LLPIAPDPTQDALLIVPFVTPKLSTTVDPDPSSSFQCETISARAPATPLNIPIHTIAISHLTRSPMFILFSLTRNLAARFSSLRSRRTLAVTAMHPYTTHLLAVYMIR
jgi:hypothetical protein